ncbi:MAG: response regulator [Burkholderiales bacterium]|nr:response regulator [Burkholderiales bacterium]
MPTPDTTHDRPPELQGKLLYIEDEAVNVQLVEEIVAHRHPGVMLVHASTGAEGVLLARSERPDFVLLDMHLPDMSGLEVVRQLNVEIANQGLRVTILTGDSLSMDIIKAMSLGAYEYWVKPLNLQLFEDGLRRALTGRRPDPARRLPAR